MDGTSEFIKRTIRTYNDAEDPGEIYLVLRALMNYFEDSQTREWLKRASDTVERLEITARYCEEHHG